MSPIQYIAEKDLISLLEKRDRRAFNYLYDNYSDALYGVVIRIVSYRQYADEVIQNVFVNIWDKMPQFDPQKGRLYTWMINIARHAAIDYIKSKAVQNEQKNQSLPEIVNNTENHQFFVKEHEKNSDYIGIEDVIKGLKPEWRLLIQMAYYEGYTQQEIADRLVLPLGTVKTRIRAALLELKVILNEYR